MHLLNDGSSYESSKDWKGRCRHCSSLVEVITIRVECIPTDYPEL